MNPSPGPSGIRGPARITPRAPFLMSPRCASHLQAWATTIHANTQTHMHALKHTKLICDSVEHRACIKGLDPFHYGQKTRANSSFIWPAIDWVLIYHSRAHPQHFHLTPHDSRQGDRWLPLALTYKTQAADLSGPAWTLLGHCGAVLH